jgi:WAS/WASL-interacting protein
MHTKLFFLISIAFCFIRSSLSQGIGDRLVRTAVLYSELPLTVDDAVNNGWTNFTDCDENLGIAYTSAGGGVPTKTHPVILYFTSGGQISGVAMEHFGDPAHGLQRFWQPTSDGNYRLTVSFRPPGGLCSGQSYAETIGTQLVVDQASVNWSLPLTEDAATAAKWTKGGCIGGMGTHWSYDLKSAPDMSWIASDLFPVVTMYNEQADGVLSAFFFTSPNLQYAEPFGPWEGPIPNALMCLNWCDSGCSFDSSFFSTLHFYIDDHNVNTCPSRCPN